MWSSYMAFEQTEPDDLLEAVADIVMVIGTKHSRHTY